MESMMGAMTRITWSIVQEECLRHMWRSSCNAGIMAMMGRKIGPAHMQAQMLHTQKSHTQPSPPFPCLLPSSTTRANSVTASTPSKPR